MGVGLRILTLLRGDEATDVLGGEGGVVRISLLIPLIR